MFTKEEIEYYKDKASIPLEEQVTLLLSIIKEKEKLIEEQELIIRRLQNQLHGKIRKEEVKTNFEHGVKKFFNENRKELTNEALENLLKPKEESSITGGGWVAPNQLTISTSKNDPD